MIKNNKNLLVFFIIPIWIISLILLFPHPSSYWFSFWWMLPIALTIAITVNTVGISGSALFVPFFIIIFPVLSSPLTVGQSVTLSLITESFGLSSSALAFWWFGLIDRKIGFRTILIAIPCVILGAVISFFLSSNTLRIIVAISLIISLILLLNKKRRESKKECLECDLIGKHHKHKLSDNAVLTDKEGKTYKYCRYCGMKKRFIGYSLGGLFQGSSGFGIGELGILSMVLTNIPIRVAIGTSHLIVAFTAIIASIIHVVFSTNLNIAIPWHILIITVPSVILGGQIAPYVSSRIKTNVLEYFVIILFSIISLTLFWISIF